MLDAAQASVISEDTQASIDAHAEARNTPYEHMKTDEKMPEVSTLKRILRLCKVCQNAL